MSESEWGQSCSCYMEPGWWSSHGWHMREITAADCLKRRLVPPDSYIGIPIVVEMCPRLKAKLEAERNAKLKQQAAGKKSNRADE